MRKPDRTAACCGEGGGDMGEGEWDKKFEEKNRKMRGRREWGRRNEGKIGIIKELLKILQ